MLQTEAVGWLGQVVIGLDHVIITMKKGDIAVFMLSPRLGYRAIGKNGVPSNYVIQFKVDLISRITEVNVCMDGGIIKKVLEKGEQIGPLPSKFLPKIEIRNLNKLWHPWERKKLSILHWLIFGILLMNGVLMVLMCLTSLQSKSLQAIRRRTV
ncbi:unnamed protein product [Camellia sinensis]